MNDRLYSTEEQAAASERGFEWLSRLERPDNRAAKGFMTWLRRSPQNGGEVLVATSTELVLRHLFRDTRIDAAQFLTPSNVLAVADEGRAERKPARRNRARFIAALGLGLAAAAAFVLVAPVLIRAVLHPSEYSTSVGEQRAIELPDGSAIAINAQSTVRVAYSEAARDVYLDAGQAMFTVAKDAARPFRVHVGPAAQGRPGGSGAVIQALGTKFDVRLRSDRINVAVIEGVVQIRSDARRRELEAALDQIGEIAKVAAGQAVSIQAEGLVTPPAPINVSDVSAWQQRRLVFADDTLADIVEEFQRYNRTPRIRIEGEALRNRRLSGVFDADYPEALLMYLKTDSSIVMEDGSDELVVRLRDEAPPAPAGAREADSG